MEPWTRIQQLSGAGCVRGIAASLRWSCLSGPRAHIASSGNSPGNLSVIVFHGLAASPWDCQGLPWGEASRHLKYLADGRSLVTLHAIPAYPSISSAASARNGYQFCPWDGGARTSPEYSACLAGFRLAFGAKSTGILAGERPPWPDYGQLRWLWGLWGVVSNIECSGQF